MSPPDSLCNPLFLVIRVAADVCALHAAFRHSHLLRLQLCFLQRLRAGGIASDDLQFRGPVLYRCPPMRTTDHRTSKVSIRS